MADIVQDFTKKVCPHMLGCPLYINNTKKACFVRLRGCPYAPIHLDALICLNTLFMLGWPICLGAPWMFGWPPVYLDALHMFGCLTVCLDAAKCMVASKGMGVSKHTGASKYMRASKHMGASKHRECLNIQ